MLTIKFCKAAIPGTDEESLRPRQPALPEPEPLSSILANPAYGAGCDEEPLPLSIIKLLEFAS
ncbi:MAG TPA: hypothetical protein VL200_17280 [Lacunisphaera sp.]|jgi:hypothetical protein|nr:hypothetical protein [Lacunisphaera sp.]